MTEKAKAEAMERTGREIKSFLRAAGRPMTRIEIEAGLVLMRNERVRERWLSSRPPDRFEGYTLSGVGPTLAQLKELGEITTVSVDGDDWILTDAAVVLADAGPDESPNAVDAHLALARIRAANCLRGSPRLPHTVHGSTSSPCPEPVEGHSP